MQDKMSLSYILGNNSTATQLYNNVSSLGTTLPRVDAVNTPKNNHNDGDQTGSTEHRSGADIDSPATRYRDDEVRSLKPENTNPSKLEIEPAEDAGGNTRTQSPANRSPQGKGRTEESGTQAVQAELVQTNDNLGDYLSGATPETTLTSKKPMQKSGRPLIDIPRRVSDVSDVPLGNNAPERAGVMTSRHLKDATNLVASTARAGVETHSWRVIAHGGCSKKRTLDDLEVGTHKENTASAHGNPEHFNGSVGAGEAASLPASRWVPSVDPDGAFLLTYTSSSYSNFHTDSNVDASSTVNLQDIPPALSPSTRTGTAQSRASSSSLKCPICVANIGAATVKTYTRRAELNRHMRQKHINGKIRCPNCEVELSNKYAVGRHIATKACPALKYEN